ncbi:MAG: hypothetical protein Q8R01_17280 [Ramlibacter sp.]|nr:hypothetical protein [Ramlibacter sp.]
MKPVLRCATRQRGGASTWVFAGFAAAALFFLLTEHRICLLSGWLSTRFGEQWKRHAASTPRFVPDFKGNGNFSRS